jgi:hypothetical protein
MKIMKRRENGGGVSMSAAWRSAKESRRQRGGNNRCDGSAK